MSAGLRTAGAAIAGRTTLALGVSQLVCWGVTYYLLGPLAPFIAADTGWSAVWIHGGYSAGLAAMGLVSPLAGRLIDRRGGAVVMTAGSVAAALGCAGIGLAHHLAAYYAAWLCLGVAMRLTLYDAAFAALARLGGPAARRPMAQVTLLGGLASTAFWPLGHVLAGALGWRKAALIYAAIALATAALHAVIPAGRAPPAAQSIPAGPERAAGRAPAALYAAIVALAAFLNSGMSAHMIGILQGLGVAATAAVGLASLRGVGQSGARLAEVLFGQRLHPLALAVVASSLLPVCFAAGLLADRLLAAGAAFALVYGAGNGLITIVRGTVPLVLFDHAAYGAVVGRLLAPSFFLSALGPTAYALVIDAGGARAGLALSIAVAAAVWLAALLLAVGGRRDGAARAA